MQTNKTGNYIYISCTFARNDENKTVFVWMTMKYTFAVVSVDWLQSGIFIYLT